MHSKIRTNKLQHFKESACEFGSSSVMLACTALQACKPLSRKSVVFQKAQADFQAQKFFFSLSSNLFVSQGFFFFLSCFVSFVSHKCICLGSYKLPYVYSSKTVPCPKILL